MSDSKSVALPAHLWEALDVMSSEMGVGRDALVSQAVFTLARLNGYVVPGRGAEAGAPAAAPPPASKPAAAAKPAPASKPAPAPPPKSKPLPQPEPEEEPVEDEGGFDEPAPQDDFQDEPPQDEEPVDEPPQDEDLPPEEEPEPAPPPPRPAAASAAKVSLTLVMANRDPYKMTTDSVTIGRGKTCEFIIESNRVSREHARIFKEAGGFILEDLKSSNGTFFGPNREKVTNRRPIRDGDEYTFGTEKVKFQIRK